MSSQNGSAQPVLALGRRMLPADAFFWFAEAATPRLRPLVAGLFLLDRSPDPKRFRASIARLVGCVPRLRQRVAHSPLSLALPEWTDDRQFDLGYHLRQFRLPSPSRERDLLEVAGAIFATPLDHMRPLWEAYLIDGLEDGRAALFLKLHHSVMDGAGSVALFDILTQARREDPVPPIPRLRREVASRPADDAGVLGAAAGALFGLGRLVGDPRDLGARLRRLARQAGALVDDLTAPAIDDPLARMTTGVGRRLDRVAIPMSRLTALKDTLGISLNDLILVSLTGAVARYHRYRGLSLPEVTCIVPMSLRRESDRGRLGNHVGAFRVLLPTGERDPRRRLARIHAQTRAAKEVRQGEAYGALMGLVNIVPAALFRAAAERLSGKVHLICSNVSGPEQGRYLAGARIESVHPFAPVMLGTPLSIALLSYGGQLGIGIDADPAAIPDPERVGRYFEAELGTIERKVNAGWTDPIGAR